MITLSLQNDFREAYANLRGVDEAVKARIVSAALNKTAAKAKTEMVRAITSEFALAQNKVRPRLGIRSASRSELKAILEAFPSASGKRSMNVIAFSARETAKGVTVLIKRGGGRKLIAGAFIGNKGRTVFIRRPGTIMPSRASSRGKKHREQIEGVMTIDIPQMFNTLRINARVVDKIRQEFPVEFDRAANFLLAKI